MNLLGPQGNAAPCLCKCFDHNKTPAALGLLSTFQTSVPQEYISILCYERAVACNLMVQGLTVLNKFVFLWLRGSIECWMKDLSAGVVALNTVAAYCHQSTVVNSPELSE